MTNDQSIGQSHNNTCAKSKTTVNESRADIHSFKQLSTMTGTEEISSSLRSELQNISETATGYVPVLGVTIPCQDDIFAPMRLNMPMQTNKSSLIGSPSKGDGFSAHGLSRQKVCCSMEEQKADVLDAVRVRCFGPKAGP